MSEKSKTVDEGSQSDFRLLRLADKKDLSGRISETSRFIAFGIVALVVSSHQPDNTLMTSVLVKNGPFLSIAGLFGCMALIFDYLQYLCGYFSVNDALNRSTLDYSYDPERISYRSRTWFFWAKQFFTLAGAIIVIALFSFELLPLSE